MTGMVRDSPWGPLAVADAHVHFFSHRFFATLVAQKPGLTPEAAREQLGWTMPPEDPMQLATEWAGELDRHGVQTASLIANIPGDEASVAAAVRFLPERFHGFAMVNPKIFQPEALSSLHA